MKTEALKEKYIKYELTKDDVFKHQHYIIITRSGIEKIQALEAGPLEAGPDWSRCPGRTTRSENARTPRPGLRRRG